MISPNVHRSLYEFSIKRFLESLEFDPSEEAVKRHVNLGGPNGYNHLLDALIGDGSLEAEDVDKFLIEELNYGLQSNMYVTFLSDEAVEHLQAEERILRCVQSLQSDFEDAQRVVSFPFIGSLRNGLNRGQSKLLYCDLEKDEFGTIDRVVILLGVGFHDGIGHTVHDYYSVEFNLKLGLLVFRIRNWVTDSEDHDGVDKRYYEISSLIRTKFSVNAHVTMPKMQSIVYAMVKDLTDRVLGPTMETVRNTIEDEVEEQVGAWVEQVLDEEIPLQDKRVIVESVLNHYYRLYSLLKVGKISISTLRNLEISGYPRYVKFLDDSVGEGRAKSADPTESLLETSVYYDLKARLDQAANIKLSTIYWVDVPDATEKSGFKPKFGTSWYTDVQGRFKVIVLAHLFTREACDYVLSKIKQYTP